MTVSVSGRRGVGVLPPRYRDHVLLAGGGMGEVYRATDAVLGRPVAVKLLAEHCLADPALRERFVREARSAARLSGGPNVVLIYDVGEWGGRPYLVMEYLSGGSIEQRLRVGSRPPVGQTLIWLGEAAAALDYAHGGGVVHRDVKPANLLLDRDDRVHVGDFGVAWAAGMAQLTQAGTVIGTAGYLAPEQARGETVTAAADQYGLAVVAFELLTGSRPYESDSATAEAAAHVTAPIPRVTDRNRRLPSGCDAVFSRALAKDASARFASCLEFVQSLQTAANEPSPDVGALDPGAATAVIAPPPPTQPGRALRRSRLLLALVLLGVAATGALATTLTDGKSNTELTTTTKPAAGAGTPTRTVTTGETLTVTTVVTATAPTPPAATGADLAQQAQPLLQAGNYQAALPLLQQAVQLLHGSGSPEEGTAEYDLAYTVAQLGQCATALPLLDQAQAILGQQAQIDQLRGLCTGPPGHQPGHGNQGG